MILRSLSADIAVRIGKDHDVERQTVEFLHLDSNASPLHGMGKVSVPKFSVEPRIPSGTLS